MKKDYPDNRLARVAEAVKESGVFSYELSNWLDDFYHRPDAAMLIERPCLLGKEHPQGATIDAYLAATASQLCKRYGWPLPGWVWDPERILEEPWFADKHDFLRATLLLESPGSFRERNLFVSANALSRV